MVQKFVIKDVITGLYWDGSFVGKNWYDYIQGAQFFPDRYSVESFLRNNEITSGNPVVVEEVWVYES